MNRRTLAHWAARNRRMAQVLIGLLHAGVIGCAIIAGNQLPGNAGAISIVLFAFSVLLLLAGLGMYFNYSPQGRATIRFWRRLADASLIAAGFCLALGLSCRPLSAEPSEAVTLHHASARPQLHPHQPQARKVQREIAIRSVQTAPGQLNSTDEGITGCSPVSSTRADPVQHAFRPEKSQVPDEPLGLELGARILIFVLAVLFAVILAYLIWGLACWVACSGLGVLGILIWLVGWILLAALLIRLAAALFKGPRRK